MLIIRIITPAKAIGKPIMKLIEITLPIVSSATARGINVRTIPRIVYLPILKRLDFLEIISTITRKMQTRIIARGTGEFSGVLSFLKKQRL